MAPKLWPVRELIAKAKPAIPMATKISSVARRRPGGWAIDRGERPIGWGRPRFLSMDFSAAPDPGAPRRRRKSVTFWTSRNIFQEKK
jgi:hypothetical protein